jgi:hypothetical protein
MTAKQIFIRTASFLRDRKSDLIIGEVNEALAVVFDGAAIDADLIGPDHQLLNVANIILRQR